MKVKRPSFFPFIILALCVLCGCEKNDTDGPVKSDGIVAAKIPVSDVRAAEIPQLFASEQIQYNAVSDLNWPEQYPYLPQVDFAVAHNGSSILIHYRVTEKRTVGTMENDLDGVWKESCCEFFCMEQGDSLYYNIESNCIGSILMECGSGRAGRTTSTADNLQQIDRWASLGRSSVGTISAQTHWELALVIPLSAFWRHSYGTLDGKTFLANVYNCVGSGDDRQYVTWYPIVSAAPDFHRPEYFGRILFGR